MILAEEKGFEPLHPVTGLRDFESRLFDHLSTPPYSERAYYNSESLENQVFFNEKQLQLCMERLTAFHDGVVFTGLNWGIFHDKLVKQEGLEWN